jgi:hypothetical protein
MASGGAGSADGNSAVDDILKGLKQWTEEERSQYCDELDHPLFNSPAKVSARD